MKKILVLTSIYPGPEIPKTFTPVVHYFTKEWKKQGNSVLVIHNLAYFPSIFYWIATLLYELIGSITGTNIPVKKLSKKLVYNHEGVNVIRLPMFKAYPHTNFSKKVMQQQVANIQQELLGLNFVPNVIVGHWGNPQLELLAGLKSLYPTTRTALVMHDGGQMLKNIYGNQVYSLFKKIDYVGFRSQPIKDEFLTNFPVEFKTFMCYSGIPEKFTNETVSKDFEQELNSFLFVGTLIKRKFPAQIVDALQVVYPNAQFQLNYIGVGKESKLIERKIQENQKLKHAVSLLGMVPREEVWEQMKKSDCFIMISKQEAFGLVYLEAMAAGCITIAGRGEGFDGIIKDGENGFLCNPGDVVELSKIIKKVNQLSNQQKKNISQKAIATAKILTNSNAAHLYLNSVVS